MCIFRPAFLTAETFSSLASYSATEIVVRQAGLFKKRSIMINYSNESH